MAVKIITLDLDGTLLLPDHLTVSPANREALKKAHDSGVKIAISTGRTIAIMGDICQQVPEVDYVMYSNGAGVMDRKSGKNIYTSFMPWELCERLIDYLDPKPVFMEIYVDGKSYVQADKAEFFIGDALPKKFLDNLTDKMTVCQNVKEAVKGRDIEKLTTYCKYPEIYEEIWQHLTSMKDIISISSSIKSNIDITGAGVHKGSALEGMCKALGITADEAMAFGDAGNDCPMLEFAKYSFAMENGNDQCKASAKFITKSNAEDGVAYAINKYVL